MTAQEITPDKDTQTTAKPVEPRRYLTLAVISGIITIAAWIAAAWNGYVGLAAGIAAIATGALALRSHRHGVRNTAITAIIAAAVLVVVLAAFIIVIYLGLKNL